MDYWALGHIHKSQVLSEEPLVVYAGNSQGLHRKEHGPKGCYLVSVSHNGHCDLRFIDTCAVRFEEIKIDIAGMQNETDFLEILRRKKENLRKQHKKNILLSIVLSGTGPLHRLCTQEGIRKLWLQESQNEEKGKSIFVMPYRIISNTRPSINLVERRLLTDVVGDYLRAYDDMVDGDAIQIAVGRDAVELLCGCDAHRHIAARGRAECRALLRAVIYRAQLVLAVAGASIKKLAINSAVCRLRGFNGGEREIVVALSASRPRRQVVRIERQVAASFAIALEVDRVEFAVSNLYAVSRDALSLLTHCGKVDLSAYIHGAEGVIAPLLVNACVAPESYGGIECLHCVVLVFTRDQLLLRHESRQLCSGQDRSRFDQLARLLRSARCRKQ